MYIFFYSFLFIFRTLFYLGFLPPGSGSASAMRIRVQEISHNEDPWKSALESIPTTLKLLYIHIMQFGKQYRLFLIITILKNYFHDKRGVFSQLIHLTPPSHLMSNSLQICWQKKVAPLSFFGQLQYWHYWAYRASGQYFLQTKFGKENRFCTGQTLGWQPHSSWHLQLPEPAPQSPNLITKKSEWTQFFYLKKQTSIFIWSSLLTSSL